MTIIDQSRYNDSSSECRGRSVSFPFTRSGRSQRVALTLLPFFFFATQGAFRVFDIAMKEEESLLEGSIVIMCNREFLWELFLLLFPMGPSFRLFLSLSLCFLSLCKWVFRVDLFFFFWLWFFGGLGKKVFGSVTFDFFFLN